MTNYERIKQMSVSELADEILAADYCRYCRFCDKSGICEFVNKHPGEPLNIGCVSAVTDYLVSEAEVKQIANP